MKAVEDKTRLEEQQNEGEESDDEDEGWHDDVVRREALVLSVESEAVEQPRSAESDEDVERVRSERVGDSHVSETSARDDHGADEVWEAGSDGREGETDDGVRQADDVADRFAAGDHAEAHDGEPSDRFDASDDGVETGRGSSSSDVENGEMEGELGRVERVVRSLFGDGGVLAGRRDERVRYARSLASFVVGTVSVARRCGDVGRLEGSSDGGAHARQRESAIDDVIIDDVLFVFFRDDVGFPHEHFEDALARSEKVKDLLLSDYRVCAFGDGIDGELDEASRAIVCGEADEFVASGSAVSGPELNFGVVVVFARDVGVKFFL